jgi:hypothetical protein
MLKDGGLKRLLFHIENLQMEKFIDIFLTFGGR